MSTPSADLILHPVRMRIILALGRGVALTASDLSAQLSDVPAATLYRHLATLVDGQILMVVDEHRVRGAVERTYALEHHNANLGPDDLATASREDHLRYFASFTATLIDEYARYLRRDEIDLGADGVSYREASLYLSDAEYLELLKEIWGAIVARIDTPASDGRRARSLAVIGIPGEPPTPTGDNSGHPAARNTPSGTSKGVQS